MADRKLVVKDGHNRGAVLPLTRDPVRIGRDPSAEVRLFDPEASREHAVITGIDSTPVIEDRGSRNGIFVNGVFCVKRRLFHGDEIRIGRSVFLYFGEEGGAGGEGSVLAPSEDTLTSPSLGDRGGQGAGPGARGKARAAITSPSAFTGPTLIGRAEAIRSVASLILRLTRCLRLLLGMWDVVLWIRWNPVATEGNWLGAGLPQLRGEGLVSRLSRL